MRDVHQAGGVKTTVVVPAFRAWKTLDIVLEALRPQIEGKDDREGILVDSSGGRSREELERRWPWLRIVLLEARALPGAARNSGVAVARGETVAFLDADAVPDSRWLDELEQCLQPGIDAVAGSVKNGTPQSAVGTADWVLEFSDFLPKRRVPILHVYAGNMLIRRHVFEQAGGFREDLLTGEDTILTVPLAAERRVAFAPRAAVRHLNRTRFRDFLVHQRNLGFGFPTMTAAVEYPRVWVTEWPFLPLSGMARLVPLAGRLGRHPREAAAAVVVLPLLVAGLAAWTVGVAAGRAALAKS
jgi:glycosyltransferase involved in cell wall biosynthesis